MLKFIKMKYYEAYQLYFSVSFVVVVVFTEMWEYLGFALVYVLNFWSAPVTEKVMLSLRKKTTNNLIFARRSKFINLIKFWTVSLVSSFKYTSFVHG